MFLKTAGQRISLNRLSFFTNFFTNFGKKVLTFPADVLILNKSLKTNLEKGGSRDDVQSWKFADSITGKQNQEIVSREYSRLSLSMHYVL